MNPKLFIPGPTHVSEDILKALSKPQIGHRTPEISILINELVDGIQKILYTNYSTYIVQYSVSNRWIGYVRDDSALDGNEWLKAVDENEIIQRLYKDAKKRGCYYIQ